MTGSSHEKHTAGAARHTVFCKVVYQDQLSIEALDHARTPCKSACVTCLSCRLDVLQVCDFMCIKVALQGSMILVPRRDGLNSSQIVRGSLRESSVSGLEDGGTRGIHQWE